MTVATEDENILWKQVKEGLSLKIFDNRFATIGQFLFLVLSEHLSVHKCFMIITVVIL